MKSPIVESVRTSSDILLHTSRGLQLPYREKSKKSYFFTRKSQIPYFTVDSVWGLSLVSSVLQASGMILGRQKRHEDHLNMLGKHCKYEAQVNFCIELSMCMYQGCVDNLRASPMLPTPNILIFFEVQEYKNVYF